MKKPIAAIVSLLCCLVVNSVFAREYRPQENSIQEGQTTSSGSQKDESTAAEVSTPQFPEIKDEPRTVDPREFLPEALGANATVNFQSRSLEDLVDWLRERGVNVAVQQAELANKGVMLADPISDWVEDAPVYLLLDRLSLNNVGWYLQDDIVCITHTSVAEEQFITRPYHLGELLDREFDVYNLSELISNAIDPDSWLESGGKGSINPVGDMIFVRHSERNHRNVQALLNALLKHGRQTLIASPPANVSIREQLSKKVSVRFRDTPLTEALLILSGDAKVDIRLDRKSIRSTRVRENQPVTLQIDNAPLESVLNLMLEEINLTWMIRDGVLWATDASAAKKNTITAVYDVRDLSANEDESIALSGALERQMPEHWQDGSLGRILFPKPGMMVAWGLESDQAEILKLLESYRSALRSSKARKPAAPTEDKVETLFYRLHSNVAMEMFRNLPDLVEPDSWKERNPEAIGTIRIFESRPEVPPAKSEVPVVASLLERKVLMIHQRQSVHKKIAEMIQKIEHGQSGGMGGMAGGGMGGGMGGGGSFGSGYF